MSGTFVISPVNDLTFKLIDGELSNYNNTLDNNDTYRNSVNNISFQKFLTTDSVKVQLRTNYDTITAKLYGSNNIPTSVPVVLKTTYTDFKFYEFILSGLSADRYRMVITGTDGVYDDLEFRSEPFEIVADFGKEDYLKVEYYNDENSFFIDYSTGITHFFWISAVNFKINPKGEIDVYNNLDNEEKLEETNFRVYSFESKEIPRHLALKFSEASSMDNFSINGVDFIRNPKPELEYQGNSNLVLLRAELTEKFSVGVNSDDRGFECVTLEPQEGLVVNIGAEGVSGTPQYTVPEGYAVRFLTMRLKTGSSATVDVGTTPGGDEITKAKVLSVIDDPLDIDRSKLVDWDGDGTVYVTIVGVGATIDFWMTAISFKDLTV